jgi:hypothetical protein
VDFACCSGCSPVAAITLAGFSVLAAIFFHWQPGDMRQMINFMKNITIARGFLVLAAAGPGALALDNRHRLGAKRTAWFDAGRLRCERERASLEGRPGTSP